LVVDVQLPRRSYVHVELVPSGNVTWLKFRSAS